MPGKPLPCSLTFLAAAFIALASSSQALAQQKEIERFDLYGGYTYFADPRLLDLDEHGFHIQAGYNPDALLSPWASITPMPAATTRLQPGC